MLEEICLPYDYQKHSSVGHTMPKGRVSKRSVDGLACPTGKDRIFLWDDALAGFGVAAFASGKKVYVAQFRKDGRSRRSTIGDHGRLTPDEARSQAKTLLGSNKAQTPSTSDVRRVPSEHFGRSPTIFSSSTSTASARGGLPQNIVDYWTATSIRRSGRSASSRCPAEISRNFTRGFLAPPIRQIVACQ